MADTKWTDDDHRIAVYGYMEMLNNVVSGGPFVKNQYLRKMAADSGHRITAGSFSYKMQNISYVMNTLEGTYLQGYQPLDHVPDSQFELIKDLINEYRTGKKRDVRDEGQVPQRNGSKNVIVRRTTSSPVGVSSPERKVLEYARYDRSISVKQWVLEQANGVCECCGNVAPFVTSEGKPYLEVHHVVPMSEHGADCPENMVALCPNCHREFHYGAQLEEKTGLLYASISRLERRV